MGPFLEGVVHPGIQGSLHRNQGSLPRSYHIWQRQHVAIQALVAFCPVNGEQILDCKMVWRGAVQVKNIIYVYMIYIYIATLLVINFVYSLISFCSPRKFIQHHSFLLRSLRWEASTHGWGNFSAFGGFGGRTTKSCWTRNQADLGLESLKFSNVVEWAIHNLWPQAGMKNHDAYQNMENNACSQ